MAKPTQPPLPGQRETLLQTAVQSVVIVKALEPTIGLAEDSGSSRVNFGGMTINMNLLTEFCPIL